MRINKYLAACGVASRRNSDELIKEGKISINGKIIRDLGVDINPDADIVMCEGRRVQQAEHVYIMIHKPKGYVTTTADDKGRKTVLDLLGNKYQGTRLFPVGRLDYETEGLLLLTTDGELNDRLTHPRNEIPKTYIAKVEGSVDEAFMRALRSGVEVDGKVTKKCNAKIAGVEDGMTKVELTITEGRNRQIRKMFEVLGKEVKFLKRMAIGDLRLGGLFRGKFRELSAAEVYYLQNL